MADKYCDQNLYAETASFTAGVNAGGNTLTVSAISGKITIGTYIPDVDPSLPYGAIVTAFGTGTGGTGTYTLHASISVGAFSGRAMTGTQGGPAAVPTWGVAQDGDGDSSGAATPSTAEVVFTGIPSSGSIAVLGVTLSPTWATNAGTCANNLATAINASTTTATGPASFTVKSQVRNHVYARGPANGAPAGTCQIMTRQGSAAHSGLIAVTHTLNNVSSAATINFSGGTSGAWGWIYSFTPMWPSLLSQFTYGVWGTARGFCGTLSDGDVVNMRANRTLMGYTWQGDGYAYPTTMPVKGTDAAPITYLIDDGTIWADGAEPVLTIHMIGQGQTRWEFINPAASTTTLVLAKKYSDTKYGLLIRTTNNTTTLSDAPMVNPPFNHKLIVQGVYYKMDSGSITLNGNSGANNGVLLNSPMQLKKCRMSASKQSRLISNVTSYGQNANPFAIELTETIIDCGTGSDAAHTGVFSWLGSGGGSEPLCVQLDSCKFINFVPGSRLFPSGTVGTGNQLFKFHLRNCDLGNITVPGPKLGGTAATRYIHNTRGAAHGIFSSSYLGDQDFFVDSLYGWCAWSSTRSFPTLNALLRDGITPWSIQVIPPQVSANVSKIKGFEVPRIVKINSLATGVRTITLEFGAEQSLTLDKSSISMMIEYVDASGNIVTIDTFDYTGGALTTSTAAWTNASGGQFTYSDSATLYFNKYKLSVTTPTAIATDTEIGAIVSVRTSVANTTKMIFIDPNLVVA